MGRTKESVETARRGIEVSRWGRDFSVWGSLEGGRPFRLSPSLEGRSGHARLVGKVRVGAPRKAPRFRRRRDLGLMFPNPGYHRTHTPQQPAASRYPDNRREPLGREQDPGPNRLRRCTQHDRQPLYRDQLIGIVVALFFGFVRHKLHHPLRFGVSGHVNSLAPIYYQHIIP